MRSVKATGGKQLIIASIVTEGCVACPPLSAWDASSEVFVLTDSSGTFNQATGHVAWARMTGQMEERNG